jgi:hypothetical protein
MNDALCAREQAGSREVFLQQLDSAWKGALLDICVPTWAARRLGKRPAAVELANNNHLYAHYNIGRCAARYATSTRWKRNVHPCPVST